MTRTRNSDDFLLQIRGIQKAYRGTFAPQIARIRSKYIDEPEDELDQILEVHARHYVVNAILAALNWRLDMSPEDGLPNLIPEAAVRSGERGTIRFLDYFGLEKRTEKPLLIVETKRPNTELPRTRTPVATLSEVICLGLRGEPLINKDWNTWLTDLRDYVCTISDVLVFFPSALLLQTETG